MSLGQWTMVVGGAIGLTLAAFGVRMLVTGRAPVAAARAFRNVREAGCYHALFGTALVLVVVGANLPAGLPRMLVTLLAVALVAVAVVRFRPRGRRRDSYGQK